MRTINGEPDWENDGVSLYLDDCLEILPMLEAGSVDAVITDPPFGTTQCKWDAIVPTDRMWPMLSRLTEAQTPIVLFGYQPFTSILICSNLEWFKYCWYWKRSIKTNFLNAKKQPLRQMMDIAVFYQKQCVYNPQGIVQGAITGGNKGTPTVNQWDSSGYEQEMTGYPTELLDFPFGNNENVHPTQKPVALMEYLIKTYTQEGDTVLDFTMGSGTTGTACIKTGRDFIGIEIDPGYFDIAKDRIKQAQSTPRLPGV